MLHTFFGEDEHTSADGAYKRALKARKWLYITSCIAVALGLRLYDEAQFRNVFKFVQLPAWVLREATFAGLIYLSVQYLLLLFQIGTTYDAILSDRFLFRRTAELDAAKKAFDQAQEEEMSYRAGQSRITDPDRSIEVRRAAEGGTPWRIYEQELRRRYREYRALAGQDIGDRLPYRVADIVIDLWRFIPPIAVAGLAFWHLFSLM